MKKEEKVETKTTKNKENDTVKVRKVTKKDTKKKKVKKDGLFKEIKKEMQKVHFPNRKDMVKYSIATIVFVVFFAVYFYAIELVMALIKSLI
ncbi:MAG: preprotein translocase subunit SecE [Bacilli bacterium]|nr:preprotein translocase subunit SecE [Bacilli bacterium]